MRIFLVSLFALVLLIGCSESAFRSPEAPIDEVIIDSYRFDKELFALENDTSSYAQLLMDLKNNQPAFQAAYFEEIMQMCPANNPAALPLLMQFAEDSLFNVLQSEIETYWVDESEAVAEIENAAANIAALLPEQKMPGQLVFYNSGFNVAVFPDRDFIGVGLEWFLSMDSELIKLLPPEQFPMYKRRSMVKENLVPDVVRGWLLVSMYDPQKFGDVLNAMISYGKSLYALKCVLPDYEEAQVLNYSNEQWAWALENQYPVWRDMVKEEMLFERNGRLINQLTKDGPFTNGFGDESAPRIGWYFGYQMVKAYMKDHQDVALQDLAEVPAEVIMKSFNPKEKI